MKALVVLTLAVCLSGCGGKSSSTPSSPTPTAQPPAPTRIIQLSGNIDFGDIQVGSNAPATLRITNGGNSTLTITGMTITAGLGAVYTSSFTNGTIPAGGFQEATIRFTPAAEQSYNGTLTVVGDQTSGTNTLSISGRGARPPGPRTTFGAGQYFVGSDVVPGRYFTDPVSGCYWERQSGLGGSLSEILANDFTGFDAAQLIVDILSSDLAFETDSQCGTWFNSPRHGAQTSITPGAWRVGVQVPAGRYRTSARAGCYWERLRNFSGNLSAILDNDFVDSAGQQIVEVRTSDIGIFSDEDCGTWTRVTTLTTSVDVMEPPTSSSEIESNREMHRRSNGTALFRRQGNFGQAPSLAPVPIGEER